MKGQLSSGLPRPIFKDFHLPVFSEESFAQHRVLLPRCLCAEDAPVTWEKEGREINEADPGYVVSMKEGEQRLEIVQPLLTDTATFSCR